MGSNHTCKRIHGIAPILVRIRDSESFPLFPKPFDGSDRVAVMGVSPATGKLREKEFSDSLAGCTNHSVHCSGIFNLRRGDKEIAANLTHDFKPGIGRTQLDAADAEPLC